MYSRGDRQVKSSWVDFSVPAGGIHIITEQHDGIFPQVGKGANVSNSGRYPVKVDYEWAPPLGHWRLAKTMTLQTGEMRYMYSLNNITYHSRMIINNRDQDHVVTGSFLVGSPVRSEGLPEVESGKVIADPRSDDSLYLWNPNDPCNAVKTVITAGISEIPYVGSILATIINLFWPTGVIDMNNVWQQCLDQIQHMIDAALLKQLQEILTSKINETGDKMDFVRRLIEENGFKSAKKNYLDLIGNYLVGLEENFKRAIDSETGRTAYQILPLFSTTVTLQMQYYGFGYDNREEFGLTNEEVNQIKIAMDTLYEDASKYVPDLAAWVDNDSYEYGGDMSNNVMSSRGYMGVHGFEHLTLWTEIYNKRSADIVIEHWSIVSYSPRIGKTTDNINLMAAYGPDKVEQPLCPKVVDGVRNKIRSIEGWSSEEMYYHNRVGGFKITFENGDNYSLGIPRDHGTKPGSINLNGAYITKAESSYGYTPDGYAIGFIRFTLSDDRSYTIGDPNSDADEKRVYALDGHFICGIYTDKVDNQKACSFLVAFQQLGKSY